MDFLNNLEKKMNEKNLNKSQLAKGMYAILELSSDIICLLIYPKEIDVV